MRGSKPGNWRPPVLAEAKERGKTMKITDEMLHLAVKKAAENGIIPKQGSPEKYIECWDKIREILEAALGKEKKDDEHRKI